MQIIINSVYIPSGDVNFDERTIASNSVVGFADDDEKCAYALK